MSIKVALKSLVIHSTVIDGYPARVMTVVPQDTYEEIVRNLEKRMPMLVLEKEIIRQDNYNNGTNIPRYDWWCPSCYYEHMSTSTLYCPSCGQALDWSET